VESRHLPEEVWRELEEIGDPAAWSRLVEANTAGWIETAAVVCQPRPEFSRLHLGEIAAISLALERRADWIVLDDSDARKVARTLGLRIIGVLGLIVWAKRHGLVPNIATAISDLQNRTNFRLSPDLVSQVLRDCENSS